MEPDLHVQIPERFKEGFSRRFDPARAKLDARWWIIKEPCGLCDEFYHGTPQCQGCPFAVFRTFVGCDMWIKRVLGEQRKFACGCRQVEWSDATDASARQQLARLRQGAEELIEWTEVEPKPRSEKMNVTATVGTVEKPALTLAGLPDGMLATVRHIDDPREYKLLRYRDGGKVLGPVSADRSGPIVCHSSAPREYLVIKVHGPFSVKFED